MAALAPLKRLGRGLALWASGDYLPVAFGGTGATTAAGAVTNLIGYQPARPSLVASATGSQMNGIGVGSGSPSTLVSLTFVATAPNVKIDASGCFSCTGSGGTENVFTYCGLYNNDTGSAVGTGTTTITTVAYGAGYRQCGASYVFTSLNVGQHYAATFYAYQGDASYGTSAADQVINVQNF